MTPQIEKRTPAAWTEYLSQEHNPVTLLEYMAGCLAHMLGAQIEATQAARHTEGMVGALDSFADGLAERSGLPYPRDGKQRLAMDEQRRALAD